MDLGTGFDGPAHSFLQRNDLAVPVAAFDALVNEWVKERLPPESGRFSTQELQLIWHSSPDMEEELRLLWVLDALRVGLCKSERRGFAGVVDEFENISGGGRRHAGDVLAEMQRVNGGALHRTEITPWRLLIPTPFGDWAACDGTRLLRLTGNPFQGL